ncbi:hypothetical protein D3C77_440050 [compost metagenome]
MIDRPRQYAHTLLIGCDLAVEVQGGQSASVKAAVKGDDCRLAGSATGDLQGIFSRFRAAVGEHPAEGIGDRHEVAQAFHQLDVRFVPGGIEGVMRQAARLVLDRRDNSRVAMSKIQYANATDKVYITFAMGIPDFRIFTV